MLFLRFAIQFIVRISKRYSGVYLVTQIIIMKIAHGYLLFAEAQYRDSILRDCADTAVA